MDAETRPLPNNIKPPPKLKKINHTWQSFIYIGNPIGGSTKLCDLIYLESLSSCKRFWQTTCFLAIKLCTGSIVFRKVWDVTDMCNGVKVTNEIKNLLATKSKRNLFELILYHLNVSQLSEILNPLLFCQSNFATTNNIQTQNTIPQTLTNQGLLRP